MGVEDKQADKFRKAVIKGDVPLMRRILRKGGLLTYTDKLGRNWLHIAALHSQEKSFAFLLESGMDPALSDQQNWTPLHAACSVGHCDIADLLIDAYQRRRILCTYSFLFLLASADSLNNQIRKSINQI